MQATQLSYGSANAITTSDTAAVNCRALYIGGAGNISIKTTATAPVVTLPCLVAGTVLPVMIDGGSVMATNTTATLLIALA